MDNYYISHISIFKSSETNEWSFYQSGPWQHDCPRYSYYKNKNYLIKLAKRKFPRIKFFIKSGTTHNNEYAVFKKSKKSTFLFADFILELIDCGFVYQQVLSLSNFIREFSENGILEINKELIQQKYFQCEYMYELKFWFEKINSCKKVKIKGIV